jgi:hypothetical protein
MAIEIKDVLMESIFNKYITQATTSPQNSLEHFLSLNRHQSY